LLKNRLITLRLVLHGDLGGWMRCMERKR
jgi:hypothetical protein